MSVKTGVKSSALPWFVTSRLSVANRQGLSDVEQACLALEKDGMPCPMDVDPESWVRDNFSYICFKYMERYPNAYKQKPAPAKKKSKAQKRAAAALRRQEHKPRKIKQQPVKVAGIDVTSTAFLSTYAWRKLRMEALIKYGRKCACCGATPATGAVMNVDHIKPRKLFPRLAMDITNLQVLCHECNHGKGNWNQSDWR